MRPDGLPKLRLEKTVSKFASSEQGTACILYKFRSHEAQSSMVTLERSSRSVRYTSAGEASCA
jgi:hypothetical protein